MKLSAITMACRTLLWGAPLHGSAHHVLGLQLYTRAHMLRTLEYGAPGTRGFLIHESALR